MQNAPLYPERVQTDFIIASFGALHNLFAHRAASRVAWLGVSIFLTAVKIFSLPRSNSTGIAALNTAKVTLGRSVITANGVYGIFNDTSNTFFSYKDNRINENGTDISGALNYSVALQ